MYRRWICITIAIIGCVVSLDGAATALAAVEWLNANREHITENLRFIDVAGASKLISARVTIECPDTTDAGKILAANNNFEDVHFIGERCESTFNGRKCTVKTPNQLAGVAGTSDLSGVLGAVAAAEATSERGVQFEPEVNGDPFAEIEGECLPGAGVGRPVTERITGSVIGEISPRGVLTENYELNFRLNARNEQMIKKLVGGAATRLEAFRESFVFESLRMPVSITNINCVRTQVQLD